MNLSWSFKPFNELTPPELYAILQLRNEVFVIEQNCLYQDADNKDQSGYHVMAWDNNLLVAYSRLIPAGIAYKEISIGRVVVSPKKRSTKLGRELMERSLEFVYLLWGKHPIKIGAQLYLKKFYESLGFQPCSEIYLEDNIEHIHMLLNPVD